MLISPNFIVRVNKLQQKFSIISSISWVNILRMFVQYFHSFLLSKVTSNYFTSSWTVDDSFKE